MRTKILIVEDSIHHLNQLIEFLKDAHEKYELLITDDGEEACEIVRNEKPNLVITDWELKGSNLSGIQIISELKKDPMTMDVPIIMATQYSSSDMLDKALGAGAVDYIRKPIDKIELLARVRATLALKKFERSEITKTPTAKIKVLFLGANPSDQVKLNLEKEYNIISKNLKKTALLKESFELRQEFAITTDSLLQAMIDEKPNIVHFSGHGSSKGIFVEDNSGNSKPISRDALESLFGYFSDSIECVILNSCYSEDQAKTIAKSVPYVVGMQDSISDAASMAFSLGFYKALGAGEDIRGAYKVGIINIKLEGISGDELPILVTSDK